MPSRGAGFWAGITAFVLLIAWGVWRLSAPPAPSHPSIIVERNLS